MTLVQLKLSEVHNLSDIIHTASKGRKSLRFGHYEEGYWESGTNRTIEVWADYSAALVTNRREAARW